MVDWFDEVGLIETKEKKNRESNVISVRYNYYLKWRFPVDLLCVIAKNNIVVQNT